VNCCVDCRRPDTGEGLDEQLGVVQERLSVPDVVVVRAEGRDTGQAITRLNELVDPIEEGALMVVTASRWASVAARRLEPAAVSWSPGGFEAFVVDRARWFLTLPTGLSSGGQVTSEDLRIIASVCSCGVLGSCAARYYTVYPVLRDGAWRRSSSITPWHDPCWNPAAATSAL
jgi:hypothetical protein